MLRSPISSALGRLSPSSSAPFAPPRIPGLGGLGLGLLLGLATQGGCTVQSIFTCLSDENCQQHGEGGRCEPNSFCSFPDAACPSGRRWHERANAEIAGACIEPEGDSVGDAGSTSGTGGVGTSDDGDTTAGVGGSTSGADSSSGGLGTTTGGGGMSSGGASETAAPLPTCVEQFGDVEGFELCEQLDDTCEFNAVLNMMGSCDDVCQMFGSTCVTAYLNEAGALCERLGDAMCSDVVNDQICVCSRG